MAMTGWKRWREVGTAGVLLGALLLAMLAGGDALPADREAKADALPADLAKIPSDSMLVASGRVADLWKSDLLKEVREKYKKEIEEGSKAFAKQFGLSLEQVERLTAVMLDPVPSREEPMLFVRTLKPYDLAKVLAVGDTTTAKKHKGETLYVGEKDRAVYPLDDRSLVFGSFSELCALIDHPEPKKPGNMAGALQLAAGKHTAVYAMNVEKLNDGIGEKLPEPLEPFRPLLKALSLALVVDLGEESRLDAALHFADEKDAKAAVKPGETGLVLLRTGLERALKEIGEGKESAGMVKLLRQFREPLKAMQIEQKGKTLQASLQVKVEPAAVGLAFVEGVQKVREAAARTQAQNNLKQIALAMHNYADTFRGTLPAHAIYDKNGKPLLSWRVAILPYIDQQELYKEFHLDEPWDSAHNKKLPEKMPKVYASPQDGGKAFDEHKTYYQGFFGKGAFFEGKKGIRLPADFPDGTSNTFMIVEAGKAVPWTRPEDIAYDPSKPLPKLGLPGAAYFLASMCDGSVRTCSHKISVETLRNVITRDDGNPIGPDF